MREKFELLARVSGWNGTLSRDSSNELSADPDSLSKLIEHVVIILEKREITGVELNRLLERQQLELEASREQVNLASNRLKEIRERLNSNESQLIVANSKISTLSAQNLALEQGLKREKLQAAWSSEELQKILDAFAIFRKEQAVQMGEIRLQSEISNSQAQESQQRLQRTIQSLKEREKQVTELQEQVSNLKTQISTNEANFTREMNSSSRMIELYKNASEEATDRISILQNEIEDLREALASSEAKESGHFADLEAELEERQSVIKIKEEQLEKMRIALDGLLKVAKVQNESESLSATADILNEFSGDSTSSSIKQIYAEYSLCRGKLARAEEECSQMRINMQEMINEINSRAPIFDSLQNDNYRLQGDVAALTEQLIKAAVVRDSAIETKKELERALINLRLEKDVLQQECDDLSQQVQRLLLEIETAGNSQENQNHKRHRGTTGEILKASEIITVNLVDLTSVAQLQQRNQELLRSLRGITAKYEALEKGKESPQLKTQLELALKELDEMHEARKRQSQMVETILKSKTNETGTCASSSATSKSSISEALSIENEQLKKQLESKQEVLKKTISELECAKKELTEEKVAKASLSSQLELNGERLKMINETLNCERIESVSLRERISGQMESFNQAQSSTYKLMADLSSSQERENRLHSQIEKFQNEVNGLLLETSRLQQEALSASGERDRLASLLSSMQGVLNEHEGSEAILKRHFTTQIEFMERELEASRSRISEITASHSAALGALERDRSELFKRLEMISEELSQKKETNLRLESALTQSKEKILDIERVLQQAATESIHEESNVKTFELRIRALATELKNQQNSLQTSNLRISELEEQLKEMENLKSQLQAEKENLEGKEANLIEAKAEIEHLKGDKERFEEELSELKEKFVESQEKIQELTKEIEELKVEISVKTAKIKENEKEMEEINFKHEEIKVRYLELENLFSTGESERKYLNLTIENLEERLKALNEQNATLLDEAQKMETSDEFDESGVIRFLREEKDKLLIEKDKLIGQVRQFQLQAEEAQRNLNSERLAVSAQAADYARLLGEVESLNSSRESGALQQHETTQMKMKMTILESQLKEKNSALTPLRESLEKAQSEIDQLKESLNTIQVDRDSWKSRFEKAISTASDTTSPLETELKQVKAQMELFRQRAIALTKNLTETRSAAQQEISVLQSEISSLQSKLSAVKEPSAPVTAPVIAPVISIAVPEASSVTSIVPESSAVPEIVAPAEDVEMAQAESETVSESEREELDEDDSIYIESSETISESISESVTESEPVSEVVVTLSPVSIEPVLSVEVAPTESESEQPVAIPTPAAPVPKPAPVEVPRKKIVSLAGIVGSSSVSASTSSVAGSTTPAMITTASGKKFIPVTFPDPPSNGPSSTSAPGSNSPGSPAGDKAKKIKKGLGKKKNKLDKKSD